eukprot:TRINITY_DN66291_c0_g1_i1.p1 TRINITY_DN66291_c0_g1~~TRINITY_DN66291_c0_g1_i1.p1  ORF type:complete len:273 (-),score=169.52 TRINITY_DN66291_c0_g1_i1:116-832(-)
MTPPPPSPLGNKIARPSADEFEKMLHDNVTDEGGRRLWRGIGDRLLSVRWGVLQKVLQQFFVRATQQDTRPLSAMDLNTLGWGFISNSAAHNTGSQSMDDRVVTLDSFGRQWFIFSSIVHSINSKLRYLWVQLNPIVIHGVLSSKRAISLLQHRKPGTFLLRFSETRPGHMSVSYVARPGFVQHTRIDTRGNGYQIDVNGRVLTYDSLEEFVLLCRPLLTLYPDTPKERVFFGDELPA